MNTVQITSVSAAAAKRCFSKIIGENDVSIVSPNCATGSALTVTLLPKDAEKFHNERDYLDAPKLVVELKSTYFYVFSLLKYAATVAGHGEITVVD